MSVLVKLYMFSFPAIQSVHLAQSLDKVRDTFFMSAKIAKKDKGAQKIVLSERKCCFIVSQYRIAHVSHYCAYLYMQQYFSITTCITVISQHHKVIARLSQSVYTVALSRGMDRCNILYITASQVVKKSLQCLYTIAPIHTTG